jgi:hypothetical protein
MNKYQEQLYNQFELLLNQPILVKALVEEADHYADTEDLSDNPYEETIVGILKTVQAQRSMTFRQWKVINYFVEQTRKKRGGDGTRPQIEPTLKW